MADEVTQEYCEKCARTKRSVLFYKKRDGTYPKFCKDCLTMHIDNYNPDTFLWILQEMDVPFVPEEWNVILNKILEKDPKKLTSSSVIGRYLAKMRLNQWADKRWADTDAIREEKERKFSQYKAEKAESDAEVTRMYENGEINEAQYKTMMSMDKIAKETLMAPPTDMGVNMNNPMMQTAFMQQQDLPDPSADLTDEDKIYLAMKWRPPI